MLWYPNPPWLELVCPTTDTFSSLCFWSHPSFASSICPIDGASTFFSWPLEYPGITASDIIISTGRTTGRTTVRTTVLTGMRGGGAVDSRTTACVCMAGRCAVVYASDPTVRLRSSARSR